MAMNTINSFLGDTNESQFSLVPYPFQIGNKQVNGAKYISMNSQITLTPKQKYTFQFISSNYQKMSVSIKKLLQPTFNTILRSNDPLKNQKIDRMNYDINHPEYSQFFVFPDYRRSVNPFMIIPNIIGEDNKKIFSAFGTTFQIIDNWFYLNNEFYITTKNPKTQISISNLN